MDLTREQINALSPDLRCCFYLQPWNSNASIQTIRDWADVIGWLAFRGEEHEPRRFAVARAFDEAARLWLFVRDMQQEAPHATN